MVVSAMGEVTETVGSDVMANTEDGREGREGPDCSNKVS